MSRTGKGELLKKAREFISESNELVNQANALEIKYRDLRQKLQPQIDELQDQAGKLFPQFSSQHQVKSSNIKDKYENLNTKANSLRNQLKSLHNEILNLRQKAKELNDKSEIYKRKAAESRKTKVIDFEESGIINNEEMEVFLDGFSQNIFNEIITLKYAQSVSSGTTEWDNNKKVTIKIGKHMNKQSFKETAAHEIGHIIYRDFLSDSQKGLWQTWHAQDILSNTYLNLNAMTNLEENFAESLKYFKFNPEELQKHSEERYIFINEIMNKI